MGFLKLAALATLATGTTFATDEKPTLTVHIVPHTHDDVGWLKTVDQYYYGANNTIQHAAVQYILSTMIPSLELNPDRKFTYVEQAFFTRWYNEQGDKMKERVKALVKNEQLSFVNGGWCMHDEAATHFMGMIDQTKLGHDFLKETFDFVPTVGWQIDPFGHSSTQASLLSAEAGFDALYFGRIDYQDLNLRRESKRVEGIWRASESLGENAEVFWGLTGSYGGNYGPPNGFNWDANFGSDEPMMDNESLEGYNVPSRVGDFVNAVWDQSNQARGNNIMMTMGSDFQYENAEEWFRNLDSLIKHVNEYAENDMIVADPNSRFSSMKLVYSNPNIYTEAKNEDDLLWEVKTDDFFPYSDCEQCFWTGYFTSRAELKKWERVGSSFLQAARQIEAMDNSQCSNVESTFDSPTHTLDAAVGVVQHHDGVSGTSKQHVAFDYSKRIGRGFNEAASYMASVLKKFLLKPDSPLEFQVCQGLNVSVCEPTQTATLADSNSEILVVAYNALSHSRTDLLAIPVSTDGKYMVVSKSQDTPVEYSVMPTSKSVVDGSAPFTLYVKAENVPAMGSKLFKISLEETAAPAAEDATAQTAFARALRGKSTAEKPIILANGDKTVKFSKSGKLLSINDQKIEQSWGYYTSFDNSRHLAAGATTTPLGINPNGDQFTPGIAGTCWPGFTDFEGEEQHWLSDSDGQNSGAYIFRPSEPDQALIELEETGTAQVFESDLVTEVHAQFGEWVSQVTRVIKGADYVEVEYTVGPVPLADFLGKEVVTRFNSDVNSGDTFYTDSNARDFNKRVINYRPTWEMEVFQPVAGNYYPVNAAIYIEDEVSSMSIMTDRTQGGASLSSGAIELMVQRRLTADDSRGVGEPLSETDEGVTPYPPYGNAERVGEGVIIKGIHRIAIGQGNDGASNARKIMDETFSSLNMFITTAEGNTDGALATEEKHFDKFEFSGLGEEALPQQLSVITLSKVYGEKGSYFVRIAHQYGDGEDAELSQPASVDLANVLPKGLDMKSWTEVTLTGNQERKAMEDKRMKWKGETSNLKKAGRESDKGDVITLNAMEIRSFKIVTEGAKLGWMGE